MNDSTSVYLRVAVPLALNEGTLTYRLDQSHLPEALAALDCAGCRVHVAVRRRPLIGLVMQVLSEPDIDAARVQPIEGLIDSVPVVNRETLSFLEDVARYYRQPIGQITHMSLPRDSLTFTAAWSARASTSTTTRESRTLFTVHDHILELLAQADEPMDVHAIRDALAATAPTDKKRVILKSVREALDQLGANGRVEKHRVCKTRLSVPHPAIAAASHATPQPPPPPRRLRIPRNKHLPPHPPHPPRHKTGVGSRLRKSLAAMRSRLHPPHPPCHKTGVGSRLRKSLAAMRARLHPPHPPCHKTGVSVYPWRPLMVMRSKLQPTHHHSVLHLVRLLKQHSAQRPAQHPMQYPMRHLAQYPMYHRPIRWLWVRGVCLLLGCKHRLIVLVMTSVVLRMPL